MYKKIKNVTAAVLCGGKSRRMGFDKAFLMDGEQYMLLKIVRELQLMFEQVVLVSDTKSKFQERADFRGITVLEDIYTEKGPLGGISTALEKVQTEYIFVMACDMPLPDVSLIGRMYHEPGHEQVLTCSRLGKPEPLFSFYHKTCLPVFKKQIEKGELKPRSAFPMLKVRIYELNSKESKSMLNLNTPKDVGKWRSIGMDICSKDSKLEIIRRDGGRQENILEILIDLQFASKEGYIDAGTAALVAQELHMSETRVYEIVSYYAMLKEKPQAKFVLKVCNSSPCHFSRSKEIVISLEKKLGVPIGKTTDDGLFAYHYIPCVGACEIGPVVKIKDTVFGNLDDEKISSLIDDLRSGVMVV